ncbi:hypothetical protein [Microbacterium candidum]|uniref:Glycosyltransferase family 2 protein n=1 Tax=Microbacterium candidum TaxID=3041922 RepID=A0ABT7MV22_9MICO|nr:hypothetical protein [Microbacterium sp. ASV49]MDL9978268.1 hypothetical protein [Microbacterium sp. ASV49]
MADRDGSPPTRAVWESPQARRRIHAYVLAADPWWLEDSVLSYYDIVDEIVVSYDETGRSWTGTPLPIEECLGRLRAIDSAQKMRFVPGAFYDPGRTALESDTAQRQAALAAASPGADWVVQLDTDEVLQDTTALLEAIDQAEAIGCEAIEFPARYLYTRTARGRFLETTRSFWRRRSGYPGPVVIRSGATLVHCRQSNLPILRVDIAASNTDPTHPRDAVVHRVVRADQAILHYSWVRDDAYMVRKAAWSGHSDTYQRMLSMWRWRTRHPVAAVLLGWTRRDREWHRMTVLPPYRRTWRGES